MPIIRKVAVLSGGEQSELRSIMEQYLRCVESNKDIEFHEMCNFITKMFNEIIGELEHDN